MGPASDPAGGSSGPIDLSHPGRGWADQELEFIRMQPFETAAMRRLMKLDPSVRAGYEEAAARLKAERKASPPGPGTMRKLKKQAEKDALATIYQGFATDAATGRKYDRSYAQIKGISTRD